MSLNVILSSLSLAVALGLAVYGFPRISEAERYTRAPGELEVFKKTLWCRSCVPSTEFSLSPNETIAVPALYITRNREWCLSWQSDRGENFTDVVVTQRVNGNVFRKTRSRPCASSGELEVVFINGPLDQVIRYYFISTGTFYTGQKGNDICPACGEIPAFTEVSSPTHVKERGQVALAGATVFGIGAVVSFFGLAAITGFLYNLGRNLLPSWRGHRVRTAFAEAKATGEAFDTEATHVYNDDAESIFRQYQDTDDMREVTERIRQETERIKGEIEKILKEKQDAATKRQRLDDEYEIALKNLKDIQDRIDREDP